ncbi:MAG TPA: hypothetical protein DDZ51_02885 [Planctomycetaceae bacterium]|nr:hypothetical protein [Planctomycetaceae bacterium]
MGWAIRCARRVIGAVNCFRRYLFPTLFVKTILMARRSLFQVFTIFLAEWFAVDFSSIFL